MSPKRSAAAADAVAREAEDVAETAHEVAVVADEVATEAAEAAVEAALASDALLLEADARRIAAQVDEERPYGLPGAPLAPSSDVRRGFSLVTGGLLALTAGAALFTVRHELVLLLLAAVIAIGLDPAVRWLVRRGLSRPAAVTTISLTVVILVAGFFAAALPPLIHEANHLVTAAPGYARDLQDQHNALGRLNAKYHLTQRLQQSLQDALSVKSAGGVLSAGTAVLSFSLQFVLTSVLVIYLLADLPRIKDALYRLVPLRRRPRFGLLADEVMVKVGGYVLGNLATSIVAIIASYVLLLILGVPYALVLSVLTGVLDLIPLVGSTIAGLVVALVALAAVSPTAAAITVGFHIVYRVFEDYWLNPRVLRRTVDVSPLVTVIAVIIGGAMLGIIGAVVAVPAAAGLQLVLTEVVYPAADKDFSATD